jgi:hypothetical protein
MYVMNRKVKQIYFKEVYIMGVDKKKVKGFLKDHKKDIVYGIGGTLAAGLAFYAGARWGIYELAKDVALNPKNRDLKSCMMLKRASTYVVESTQPGASMDKLKDMYDIALKNGFTEDSKINGVLIYGDK